MTRPLADIERQAALLRTRNELVAKLNGGGITAAEAAIEVERLHAINDELDALKPAPPAPPPPVIAEIGKVSPAEAAKRAAEIRKDPRYWDPSKADADGKKLTAEEHGRLVREHQELNARAAEET